MSTANNNSTKFLSYRQELPQEPLKNGVYGSQLGRYFILIDDQVVAGPYPRYWQTVDIYRERQEMAARGEDPDPYAGTSLAEIPNDYWKNGDCEPLRIDSEPRCIPWNVCGERRMLEVAP